MQPVILTHYIFDYKCRFHFLYLICPRRRLRIFFLSFFVCASFSCFISHDAGHRRRAASISLIVRRASKFKAWTNKKKWHKRTGVKNISFRIWMLMPKCVVIAGNSLHHDATAEEKKASFGIKLIILFTKPRVGVKANLVWRRAENWFGARMAKANCYLSIWRRVFALAFIVSAFLSGEIEKRNQFHFQLENGNKLN